jgi:hypothetical protein
MLDLVKPTKEEEPIMTDTLRKTDFETLLATLDEQQERKVDVVVPASAVCFGGGNLRVLRSDLEPELTETGVKSPVQVFAPNEVFDEGIADRLKNNGVGVPRGVPAQPAGPGLDRHDRRHAERAAARQAGRGRRRVDP